MNNVISHHGTPSNVVYSSQITDSIPASDVSTFPIPRLSPFLMGLCQRYLKFNDDIAMIAAEQLVDGMDLDEDWCEKHLSTASLEIQQLVARLVDEKRSRLDDFSGYTVTCFVANDADAERLRRIPGYE
jgi:hypothetical protein